MTMTEKLVIWMARYQLAHRMYRDGVLVNPWWWPLFTAIAFVFLRLYWVAYSPFTCPRCGGPMRPPDGILGLRCAFCRTIVLLRDIERGEYPHLRMQLEERWDGPDS